MSNNILSFFGKIIGNFFPGHIGNKLSYFLIIDFGGLCMDEEIFFILIDFFNKPSIFKLQITEEPLG